MQIIVEAPDGQAVEALPRALRELALIDRQQLKSTRNRLKEVESSEVRRGDMLMPARVALVAWADARAGGNRWCSWVTGTRGITQKIANQAAHLERRACRG